MEGGRTKKESVCVKTPSLPQCFTHPKCGLPHSPPTSSSPHPQSLRCPQKCSQIGDAADVCGRGDPRATDQARRGRPWDGPQGAEPGAPQPGAQLRPGPASRWPGDRRWRVGSTPTSQEDAVPGTTFSTSAGGGHNVEQPPFPSRPGIPHPPRRTSSRSGDRSLPSPPAPGEVPAPARTPAARAQRPPPLRVRRRAPTWPRCALLCSPGARWAGVANSPGRRSASPTPSRSRPQPGLSVTPPRCHLGPAPAGRSVKRRRSWQASF
jgi:hypothetical protein